MASIKKNIILNVINTLTGIIFPIITFPYAARVLLPDGIGAVNFELSVVNYIVLLTSLGIPLYAVKEIARYRDDRPLRDRLTVEITLLSVVLCAAGYLLVWLLAMYVPKIHEQRTLFYILSLTILFTAIGVNWFYQGIEDFKFITVRAVIIRCLSAVALFVFVRDSGDLPAYAVIIVATTVGNNLVNFVHLRRHISLKGLQWRSLRIFRHLRPAISVFIFNLVTSLYIWLNSVMLGLMSGDGAVGYYTAGTKISHVALMVITSLGTVLLPRCSHLLKSGDTEGFANVISKSLRLTLGLSLPVTAGLMVLAWPVTMVFCGGGFAGGVPVLLWNAPVIVFIGLTNVMGIQVLFPMDKFRIVLISVSGGAAANLALNFLLIPPLGATGAAIGAFVAEAMVLAVQIVMGRRYFPFGLRSLLVPSYYVGTAVMTLGVALVTLLDIGNIMQIVVGSAAGIIIYAAMLRLMHDDLFAEMTSLVTKRFRRGGETQKSITDERI